MQHRYNIKGQNYAELKFKIFKSIFAFPDASYTGFHCIEKLLKDKRKFNIFSNIQKTVEPRKSLAEKFEK